MNAPLKIEEPKQAARRLMSSKLTEGYTAEALHTYTNNEGDPLYWRIRLKHPTLEKVIRPMSLINGVYVLKEPLFNHSDKPLYNLHKLATDEDKTVFIVEGEKCADILNKLDLLATTSGGADSLRATNFNILANREVVIWRDNDNAGKNWKAELIIILQKINCKIKLVDIDALNLPIKSDCVDWLADFERVNKRIATSDDVQALSLLDAIQAPTSHLKQGADVSVYQL